MNAYDFDYTVYDGDSVKDFYWYCLRNRWLLARYWPRQLWALWRGRRGRGRRSGAGDEGVYVFLRGLPDVENFVYDFWRHYIWKIKHFYLVWQRPDDLIISASPAFLLEGACRRLGIVNLIATEVDTVTGRRTGPGCHGAEKLRRFRAEYPGVEIESFYSDSRSDEPLAKTAGKSYLVAGEQVFPWYGAAPEPAPRRGRRKPLFARQLALFSLSALIHAAGSLLFSLLYSLALSVVPAYAAGYLTGLALVYPLRSRLGLGKALSFRQYGNYCLAFMPAFLIQNLTVLVAFYLAARDSLTAYALAGVLGLPLALLILKRQIFPE